MATFGAPPLKNTAFTFPGEVRAQADPTTFKSAPTIAAGDFKVSIDGGAYANLTNLPTASGVNISFVLIAAEMNGDCIKVKGEDVAGAEWVGRVWTFFTVPTALSTYAGADTSGTTTLLARIPTFPTNFSALSISAGGLVDILQTAADKVWGTVARTLTAFGFTVTPAAGSITTSAFAVGAIDNTVLSSNAEQAIADKVSANAVAVPFPSDIKKINGTTVNGNGAGTPWGP